MRINIELKKIQIKIQDMEANPEVQEDQRIGLALSGGGSRAIAFHLGTMKTLDQCGLLESVVAVSTVSGGSVIGALWAYSDLSFAEFEARVEKLLQKGLAASIFVHLFWPKQLFLATCYLLVGLPINTLFQVVRVICTIVSPALRLVRLPTDWIGLLQPPVCRWASRSTAFDLALDRLLFKGLSLDAKTRNGMGISINSCDMTTGTAFRCTNEGASSYAVGKIPAGLFKVSTAVAASAAYPMLLPAIDIETEFQRADKTARDRVLLTDGGVFDNLGTSVLSQGRDPSYSVRYTLDYVISSSAGQGRPGRRTRPYWIMPRLVSSTLVMFRKLQDAGYSQLADEKASGRLKGFALAYLAQQDAKLTYPPKNGVPRERVINYPTNFSAMREDDLVSLKRRGELLMASVLLEHCPELLTDANRQVLVQKLELDNP